jgi:protoporphyrinogen oxidase
MKKIAIIGGGFLGITLAYYLAKNKDKSVTIYEKSDSLGGLASTINIEGENIEKYYHHFFKSDTSVQELIKELGLADKLDWLKSEVSFFADGQIYNFSTSLDLLKFSKLSFFSRLRAGFVSLYLQKSADYKKFENVTALDWCNKYYGKEVTNVIWKQLLLAKFGDKYYDKVAMSWLWARIHDRSSSRNGILGKEYLGYLQGSFQVLIDAIQKYLVENNVKINLNTKLDDYHRVGDKHSINGEEYDQVVVTTPPEFFSKHFAPPAQYQEQLQAVKFIGAVCLILKLKQSFGKHYWTNIADDSYPFLALVEHTNFVDQKLFKGKSILYLAKYVDTNDRLYHASEDELFEIYCEYLKKINPNFDKTWVIDRYYFKTSHAQHIVPLGYKPVPIFTGIAGLFYVNFSQIYPHDRGTNYAVDQAKEVFNILVNE